MLDTTNCSAFNSPGTLKAIMRWSSAEGPSLTLVSKPETLLTTKLVILLTLSGLATRLISISCPCL